MSLRDEGFTFCISPNKELAKWVHPAERPLLYQDWTDVTDWPSDDLVAYLMPEPKQQELFAA